MKRLPISGMGCLALAFAGCSGDAAKGTTVALVLPEANCAGAAADDQRRYGYHDRFQKEYTRVLEAGGPRQGYELHLYTFGAHWQEHTADGFESYLGNYLRNDMVADIQHYRDLLQAMGASRSLDYLDTALGYYRAGDQEGLDALPIDYGLEEDAMYLAMCYLELNREAL